MTKEELIKFEDEVAERYCNKEIKAPIHLSDGNEDQIIEIFKLVNKEDWIFSTWRSHYHALLHGIPRDVVMQKILDGLSITMMFPEYNFFSSAIVGGILPIAVGTALGIKKKEEKKHVWCFVGDMAASIGQFYEAVNYSSNFKLPITFVIEDNGQSVGTPTQVVWSGDNIDQLIKQHPEHIKRYFYKKEKYPHHGAGQWVTF